jgi:hypothetical protein
MDTVKCEKGTFFTCLVAILIKDMKSENVKMLFFVWNCEVLCLE